jgi:hypothetical protein
VPDSAAAQPTLMLLDGQQRLTSLYQVLLSGQPVETVDSRGQAIKRWYYVSIDEAISEHSDRDQAIRAIPVDRRVRSNFGRQLDEDYSTDKKECAAGMFPLRIVFDANAREDWSEMYKDQGDTFREKWKDFRRLVLDPITNYVVPLIKLAKDTPQDAVCTVFEKVNTGGIQLTVFELLTAMFAGDRDHLLASGKDFELGSDWKKVRSRLLAESVLAEFATEEGNPAFLQAICLLVTRDRKASFQPTPGQPGVAPAVSCKRTDMLRLSLPEYSKWRDPVADAFKWCASFLTRESIYRARDLPYPSQLVPLAVLRVLLGKKADNHGVYQKLRRWYWCGVLGELYGGATETRSARDVEQVYAWIAEGGPVPETITSAVFRENRLLTLSSRMSAAYKGLYALIMAHGCEDWLHKQRLDFAVNAALQVDIHHVFPREWCKLNGISGRAVDSIVNKTAISFDTNRAIGAKSPADYLAFLEKRAGIDPAAMDVLVASHSIDPDTLRRNDFKAYTADRTNRLLKLVEEAMGNKPIRSSGAGSNPGDDADS